MTKRKRLINAKKLMKEGRGQGLGSKYKPWLKIQDVPSLGRVSRIKGIRTERQHEFLSDLERNYFYILDYANDVLDIREQYPLLPIEETQYIAKLLGVEHPKDPKTGEDIVMTTDFFITREIKEGTIDVARTIKPKSQLLDKRIIEKFEIERIFWENQGISWAIVTDEDIDKTIAQNIMSFHSYYDIDNLETLKSIDKDDLIDLECEYIRRIIHAQKSIKEYSSKFDKELGLQAGTGINIFMHLLATKKIRIDLTKQLKIGETYEILYVEEYKLKEAQNI